MTNKAEGDIEYGCEACKRSIFRAPIFYYFLDWCPKCGVERRFFTMASYAVKAKLAEYHKAIQLEVRKSLEAKRVAPKTVWTRIKEFFSKGGNMGLRNDMIRRKA